MLRQDKDIYCGTFNSSIIFKNQQRTNDREVMCYEIELFFEDSGVSHINGKAYPIRRGMLLCSKPGQIRFSDLPLKCRFIRVFTDGLDPEIGNILKALPDVRYIESAEETERLLGMFQKLGSHFISSANKLSDLRINSLFFEILHSVVKLSDDESKPSGKVNASKVVREAYEYINENYKNGCSLAEIAEAVNLSPNYLHTVFTKTVGMTPYECLISKRIEKAKSLIMAGELTILEIALEVGFCSQSHFNKVFHAKTGMTPAVYRKELFSQY